VTLIVGRKALPDSAEPSPSLTGVVPDLQTVAVVEAENSCVIMAWPAVLLPRINAVPVWPARPPGLGCAGGFPVHQRRYRHANRVALFFRSYGPFPIQRAAPC